MIVSKPQVRVGPAYLPDGTGPFEITVSEGRIAQVTEAEAAAAPRRYVAPGLIDIQVNGYGGVGFAHSDLTVADVRRAVDLLAGEGVTRFVPTIITGAHDMAVEALTVMAAACEQDPRVRHAVLCFHVEGPWISPDEGPRGAHPVEHIRPPDWAEFEAWQEAAGGRIGYVTLAPEVEGAVPMIERLAGAGIVVAIGHSGASTEQIRVARAAGARLSTHLGNGSHAVLPRHENYLWAQLSDDELWASFIPDGHHVPGPMLKSLIRAKTPARSILISDATRLAGMPVGRYTEAGMKVEIRPNGALRLAGTPYLAGSAQGLLHGLATAGRIGGVSLAQAVDMASAHPARHFGIDDAYGRIQPGMSADLIEFDWDPDAVSEITLQRTIAAGEVTYRHD